MKNLMFIASLVILLMSCNNEPHTDMDAIIQSDFWVKAKLKSPSTADFGLGKANKTGENSYHVENYVDGENVFGATIRNDYELDIEFSADGQNFTITNYKME